MYAEMFTYNNSQGKLASDSHNQIVYAWLYITSCISYKLLKYKITRLYHILI